MYQIFNGKIQRLADKAFVPEAEGNRDYVAYQAWVAAGNTADVVNEIINHTPLNRAGAKALLTSNSPVQQVLRLVIKELHQEIEAIKAGSPKPARTLGALVQDIASRIDLGQGEA